MSALVASLLVLAGASGSALAAGTGSGYYVTFAARWCASYSDIYANRARNDIVESLQDLGPDTQYGNSGAMISPNYEDLAPQGQCHPISNWSFTLGTGYQTRAVTGVWGSLSKVTNAYSTTILTRSSTPLLDTNAQQVPGQTVKGATTVELTDAERQQANNPSQLWAQGGTPTDPVLAEPYPGPEYGFGTLRCATDNLNGDNVEFIFFPQGVRHVFCYAYYVKPPPTTGVITIRKETVGAPAADTTAFPFSGSISFNPGGFQLSNGGSVDFYRAGGQTWTATEGTVANFRLTSITCTSVTPGGAPGVSTEEVNGSSVDIHLVALEHVTCTYVNQYVPPPGGLTLLKVTDGGVGDFGFTVAPATGGGSSYALRAKTLEPNVQVEAQPGLPALAPGRYDIAETTPSDTGGTWTLKSVECDGTALPVREPIEVTVTSGQGSTCLFTNSFTPSGAITVAKVTRGAVGRVGFAIAPLFGTADIYTQTATTTHEGVAAQAIPDTPGDATHHLDLGRYMITEQAPAGTRPEGSWSLTSVSCNGELVPFDQGAVIIALTRREPAVHCVYTDLFTAVAPPEPPTPPEPNNPVADLAVTKTATPAVIISGGAVTYTVTVTNHGPDAADGVVVDDEPLGHVQVIAVHADVGRCMTGVPIVCELGTLAPGASAHITVVLRVVRPPNALVNRAVVGSSTDDPNLSNNAASARVRIVAPPVAGMG